MELKRYDPESVAVKQKPIRGPVLSRLLHNIIEDLPDMYREDYLEQKRLEDIYRNPEPIRDWDGKMYRYLDDYVKRKRK